MRKTVIFLVASLLVLGAAKAEASDGADVAFEEVLLGQFSLFYDGPSDLVIRNEGQWCEFWEQAHGNRSEPPPCDLSLVDFRDEAVIASAIGGSNGCVTINITHIEAGHGRGSLRVFVRDTVPGPFCICTQSLVFPVHAVVVSKPVGRVRFIHETAELQCPIRQLPFPRRNLPFPRGN